MPETGADLGGFLEAAGQSLVDAQGSLAGEIVDIPAAVAISEESWRSRPRWFAGPTAWWRSDDLDPGHAGREHHAGAALDSARASTSRWRDTVGPWVGAADEEAEGRDRRGRAAARTSPSLDKILGGLVFEAIYVSWGRRWLVTAKDAEQRLVREVVVPDEKR